MNVPLQASSHSSFKTDDPAQAFRLAKRRIMNNALRRKQKSIDLSLFGLIEVPSEIGMLSELHTLVLSRNRITRLPREIGNLKKLERIYLSNNMLSILPDELWRLPFLKLVELNNNQLTELPSAIGHLRSLEDLSATGNNLSSIPDEIGFLLKLRELNLSENRIRKLPNQMGNLKSLVQLNLADNEIEELPDSLTELTSLDDLTLMGNSLSTLPQKIGNLKSLSWLDLDRNRIANLPDSIGDLKSLTSLYLSNAGLQVLPAAIGRLSSLESLSIDGNQLVNLPTEIGNLKQLSALNVNSNALLQLPREIGGLDKLVRLNASDNSLEEIPSEVGDLNFLEFLYLRNNRLTSLPVNISRVGLSTLDLANNRLADIPTEYGDLRSLELAAKRPHRGSRQFSTRNIGHGIYLEGNPLVEPFPSLIASGQPLATTNVLSWLRGELDQAAFNQSGASADKNPLPPEPEPEIGPDFRVSDGKFDLVGMLEKDAFDEATQEMLLQLLRKKISLLRAENIKVGNQHPLLVRTVDEYAELLARPLKEIEIVNLWSLGNGLMAQAFAFERQDARRTIAEPLEPSHLGLLIEVSRLHGGFVLGFPMGIQLTEKADKAQLVPEVVQAIQQPTSDLLSSLAKQRRLVSTRVSGLADSLEAGLISASWGGCSCGPHLIRNSEKFSY